MAQWKSISLQHGRTIDRISLWPNYFFLKLCIYSVIFLQLQTSLQKYFGPTGLKLWSIFLGKTLIMKWNFCLGDLGGYGIADQPPAKFFGYWAALGHTVLRRNSCSCYHATSYCSEKVNNSGRNWKIFFPISKMNSETTNPQNSSNEVPKWAW